MATAKLVVYVTYDEKSVEEIESAVHSILWDALEELLPDEAEFEVWLEEAEDDYDSE